MPKISIALSIEDLSSFTKALRRALSDRPTPPSHLEMMNMLARAAGHRNLQHLRAGRDAPARSGVATPDPLPPAVEKAARFFDANGVFASWPARTSLQTLCLWPLWARIDPDRTYTEIQISRHLDTLHAFGDAAILRRTLCSLRLMERSKDGSVYRRCEATPSGDGAFLIDHVLRAAGGPPREAAKPAARRGATNLERA